jgi:hypothetical protein
MTSQAALVISQWILVLVAGAKQMNGPEKLFNSNLAVFIADRLLLLLIDGPSFPSRLLLGFLDYLGLSDMAQVTGDNS